ncbi:MAG: sigma-70 family RNA polymerase sigma factor [Planctomycetaceae bacterium]
MISLAPVKRAPRRRPTKASGAPETVSGRSARLEALRQRRRAFFAKAIDFIPCRQFLAADAADAVARVPAPPTVTTTKAPADASGRLSAYVAGLYRTRLLSREEEQFHFRRLNWLKFRAATERGRLDEKRATDRQMDAVEKLLADAETSRSLLITSNLRLVVSIAKKFVNPDDSFDELVAEGNVALMRSVDKFDFSLGNRFSTYATYAIQRHYFRLSHRGRQQRKRFAPADESLRSVPEVEGAATCSPGQVDLLATLFRKFLGELEPREREIVVARFGFDGRPPRTFRELGAEMGVCKERIRQIQSRAMDKIRGMAAEARLEQTVGDWL